MKRKQIEEIARWTRETGWCVVFVILHIADALNRGQKVNVNMTSDKDLALLRQSWQEKCVFFSTDLQEWPGMRLQLMYDVFQNVYNLRCKQIWPGISGCSLDFLQNHEMFYKKTGVGVVDLENGAGECHVMMFKVNKTKRAVIFKDAGYNSRKTGWNEYALRFVVVGVHLVRSHACCLRKARYPCASCQADRMAPPTCSSTQPRSPP
jgi:hypothetical protein